MTTIVIVPMEVMNQVQQLVRMVNFTADIRKDILQAEDEIFTFLVAESMMGYVIAVTVPTKQIRI